MAIAHKILVAAYAILRDRVPYRDLGDTYLDQRNPARTVANLVSRLAALGFEVALHPRTLPAQTSPVTVGPPAPLAG